MLFDIRTELFVPDIDSVFSSQGIKKHVVDLFVDSRHNLWYVTEKDELFCRDSKNKKTPCIYHKSPTKQVLLTSCMTLPLMKTFFFYFTSRVK